jgi:hypothetical protein
MEPSQSVLVAYTYGHQYRIAGEQFTERQPVGSRLRNGGADPISAAKIHPSCQMGACFQF